MDCVDGWLLTLGAGMMKKKNKIFFSSSFRPLEWAFSHQNTHCSDTMKYHGVQIKSFNVMCFFMIRLEASRPSLVFWSVCQSVWLSVGGLCELCGIFYWNYLMQIFWTIQLSLRIGMMKKQIFYFFLHHALIIWNITGFNEKGLI